MLSGEHDVNRIKGGDRFREMERLAVFIFFNLRMILLNKSLYRFHFELFVKLQAFDESVSIE